LSTDAGGAPAPVDVTINAAINGQTYPLGVLGVTEPGTSAQQLAEAFRAIADLLDPPEPSRPRPEAPPTSDLER